MYYSKQQEHKSKILGIIKLDNMNIINFQFCIIKSFVLLESYTAACITVLLLRHSNLNSRSELLTTEYMALTEQLTDLSVNTANKPIQCAFQAGCLQHMHVRHGK